MALELCQIVNSEPSILSYQLGQLKHRLDEGKIKPIQLIADECFLQFVNLQRSPSLRVAHNAQQLFRVHLPEFYINQYAAPFAPSRKSELRPVYSTDAAEVSSGSNVNSSTGLSPADRADYGVGSDYGIEFTLKRALQLPVHVATPHIEEETKLPIDLARLIGQFHTSCDTLTEGGKMCGLGDESPFDFRYAGGAGPIGGIQECQTECTSNLCVDWLTHLITSRPKEIVIEIAEPIFASIEQWRIPVRQTSFAIADTHWKLNAPTYLEEASPSSFARFQRDLPDVLSAGCRILHAGSYKDLELDVTLELNESKLPAQESELIRDVLRTVLGSQMQAREHQLQVRFYFSNEAPKSGESSSGVTEGVASNYFTNSSTSPWRIEQLDNGRFVLKNRLTIYSPEIIAVQRVARFHAAESAKAEKRLRQQQSIGNIINASSNRASTSSTSGRGYFPPPSSSSSSGTFQLLPR